MGSVNSIWKVRGSRGRFWSTEVGLPPGRPARQLQTPEVWPGGPRGGGGSRPDHLPPSLAPSAPRSVGQGVLGPMRAPPPGCVPTCAHVSPAHLRPRRAAPRAPATRTGEAGVGRARRGRARRRSPGGGGSGGGSCRLRGPRAAARAASARSRPGEWQRRSRDRGPTRAPLRRPPVLPPETSATLPSRRAPVARGGAAEEQGAGGSCAPLHGDAGWGRGRGDPVRGRGPQPCASLCPRSGGAQQKGKRGVWCLEPAPDRWRRRSLES